MASADLYTAFHDRAFFTLKTFKVLLICVVISITNLAHAEYKLTSLSPANDMNVANAILGDFSSICFNDMYSSAISDKI